MLNYREGTEEKAKHSIFAKDGVKIHLFKEEKELKHTHREKGQPKEGARNGNESIE